ncbi:MAG: hypothetical protein DMG46_08335 [Acidobacteria bacterium]|nr:MAG: hypothetical protein DMG46_08335 [Acidobacteriota bacterium]
MEERKLSVLPNRHPSRERSALRGASQWWGPDLNTLVTSTILPNLCPPPDQRFFAEGIHTPWIKPGRAVWRYVDGGPEGVDGMKEFARMAGQLGFEYNVIEGFWSKWTPEQRKEVVDYSRQQGVGVWFWKHGKDLRTPEAREEFFKMLHDLGVTGAKIDFFDHEAKEVIDLYEALLEKAAEYHILLVFHGANKPTGRQRTWPNELVREAIRGMESSALKERARHETILPFTRLLTGPADYTAMLFNDRRRDTTVAHQIASIAVFAAPLLTIAANPQTILSNPLPTPDARATRGSWRLCAVPNRRRYVCHSRFWAKDNTMVYSSVIAPLKTSRWKSRSQFINAGIPTPSNCGQEAVSWVASRNHKSFSSAFEETGL